MEVSRAAGQSFRRAWMQVRPPGGTRRRPATIDCANTQRPEAEMAKKSRKKKARRKNAANHGKRPNA
jgi:hypothetical protein